jgi:hypothetical protein
MVLVKEKPSILSSCTERATSVRFVLLPFSMAKA